MDFSLTDEQSMLADSVARFINDDYGFERRQRIAASGEGYSRAVWQAFAELGWTALLFDEQDGGFGGGPIELMLIMEQLGRGLVLEPFLPTVVLAGGVLKRTGSPAQKSRWLEPLIAGELQGALAFAEPQGRFNACDIRTTAAPVDGGHLLDGRKALVLNGGAADLLIVPARTGDERADRTGITLFAVPSDTAGVVRRPYRTVDGLRAAEVRLEAVRVPADGVLGSIGGGGEVLLSVLDEATLAVCAEAYGIVSSLLEKTVEYTKSRVQFGVPIASFQALQHRMVDMLIAREQIHSLLTWATMLAASYDPAARRAVSAVKYQVGTAGRLVAQEAVQMHGGMGMSWELDVAHYFKRFSAIEVLFGNADYHLDRYVESHGPEAAP